MEGVFFELQLEPETVKGYLLLPPPPQKKATVKGKGKSTNMRFHNPWIIPRELYYRLKLEGDSSCDKDRLEKEGSPLLDLRFSLTWGEREIDMVNAFTCLVMTKL